MSTSRDVPLKVALITAFPPGRLSLNEYGWHLALALAEDPHVSKLAVIVDDDPQSMEPATNAELTRLLGLSAEVQVRPGWKFNSYTNLVRLIKHVRATRPDVVLLNLQFATFGDKKVPGGLGLLAPWLIKIFAQTPTVVIQHNLIDNINLQDAGFAKSSFQLRLMQSAGRFLTRSILQASLVSVTIERYVAQLSKNYGSLNVYHCPHGSFSTPPLDLSVPDKPKIMTFGKWGTYKKVELLIEAYEKLLAEGIDVELVIAGSDSPNAQGYLKDVEQQYQHLNNLTFTGYVAEEDVAELFKDATMVVLPYTSTTGSSGVLHQVGEFSRAAVVPRVGDLIDVIEHEGYRGEYFVPHDIDSLATALKKLLTDAPHREEIARANHQAACGTPMSSVAAMHISKIYDVLALGPVK